MPALRVAVVGGGVIGLSCAVELARAGHAVTLVSADAPERTTSARAGALWFPYHAAPLERILPWGAATLTRLAELAADGATGVAVRRGRVLHRTPVPDLTWTSAVPGFAAVTGALPRGVVAATESELPVADMSRYLPWLVASALHAGVRFVTARLGGLDEARELGDIIVNATGLAARELARDASVYPVRGQIVRLANPGVQEWLLDDNPGTALTYVIPRGADVVCGGTSEPGEEDLEPDAAVEAAILARAREVVPALAAAPVVSRAVGLRPARASVRLEREETAAGPIVHCYGHGGAGVTLSWGCAAEVVALVGGA